MQRVLVVPWSMAATNLVVIAQPSSDLTFRFWYFSISSSWRSLWASSRAFKLLKYPTSGFISLAPAATGVFHRPQ
jgi:hypothetical protein